MNVFQKCLRRQMGNREYAKYIQRCRTDLEEKNFSQLAEGSRPIIDAIYRQVKNENGARISERLNDLWETMETSARITSQFALVFLAYLAGNAVLIFLELNYYVTCVSLALMGACFLYKLIEFVSNKYCVVDAYLFIMYKAALERRKREI